MLTLALLGVVSDAAAQAVGTGGYLQQIPPSPEPPRPAPDIRFDPAPPPAAAFEAGASVRVDSLRITGQTVFTEAQLLRASGFAPGDMDLGELRTIAAAVAAFYNRQGYFVAQAYLPPQDVEGGQVAIAVIEGRYGQVGTDNRSRLSDRVVGGILRGLDKGDPVANGPLERRLLILSDVPGVRLGATLSPGAEVGSSDLTVRLNPERLVTGALEADNAGNRYTGEIRGGGSLYLNNPTGMGDLVSLRLLTSGSGLTYLRGAYDAPVGVGVVGVSYADVRYRLGKQFKPLQARGTARLASLYGAYPLVRSRDENLSLLGDLTFKRFDDRVGATHLRTERQATTVTLGLRGDRRDGFGGGGLNRYSVAVTGGDIDLRTPAARAQDRAAAEIDGGYGKLGFTADRLQALRGPFSLYGALRGQLASANLDISEKMELGGAYGVRAYPEGEGYGDSGLLATLEGRWLLRRPTLGGRVTLIGFIDAGQVRIAQDPWFAGPNRLTRSGAGAGAIWAAPGDFQIKASYAHRLGSERATSGGGSAGRVWVQLVKLF